MNVWNFTGNLGKDAESRYASNGEACISFSVAVKSGYGERATTTWPRCQMWGKRGEAVAPYLTKGTQVGISGEVSLREWEDKSGQKRQSLEVRVNDLTLLGKREGSDEPRPAQANPAPQQSQSKPPAKQGGFGEFDDSDIPF